MKLLLSYLVFFAFTALGQKHVFYLHGRIIETMGPNAVETSNGYGAYKYFAIIDSLKSKGFVVHSEARKPDTQIEAYALLVANEIKQLLKTGVAAKDITVIGASKGAAIAKVVSLELKNQELSYVLLAGCCDTSTPQLYGKVLSIFETSDSCGSCDSAKVVGVIKEIALSTGKRHGFFYQPTADWLTPTVKWCLGN